MIKHTIVGFNWELSPSQRKICYLSNKGWILYILHQKTRFTGHKNKILHITPEKIEIANITDEDNLGPTLDHEDYLLNFVFPDKPCNGIICSLLSIKRKCLLVHNKKTKQTSQIHFDCSHGKWEAFLSQDASMIIVFQGIKTKQSNHDIFIFDNDI